MSLALLGLGANIGDREEDLRIACGSLSRLPGTSVISRSAVYETDPVGYADQPDFLNMCVLAETELPPYTLLGACLGIEAAMGRIREIRNGPRIMDIDLLLYEGFTSDDPVLTVPHPRMSGRGFVLVPMLDLGDRDFYDSVFGFHLPEKKFFDELSDGVRRYLPTL